MENKDIKKYYFSEIVAKDVGVEEAIMFNNINFWINKNRGKKNHFHKGKDWMYCSVREFKDRYPFWTEAKIKRILRNLKKKDYILIDTFNRYGPDKTKWYTISEKGLSVINNNKDLVKNSNPIS